MSNKKSRIYIEQVQTLRDRLHGRDYSIGLDLGVGSIGLAVIAEEITDDGLVPNEVVFTTSRIFSSSEGAADRRLKRLQRNAIRHKANRMAYLWKLLASLEMMLPYQEKETPDPAVLRFSETCRRADPYRIRYRGLHEKLSLEELGYALYHISNHRGSSSIRTFLDEETTADDKKAQEQLRKTETIAKEKHLSTFIEILVEFNKEKPIGCRNRDKRKNENVPLPTRDVINNEVKQLLGTQAGFYPDILTENNQQKILSAIMYENLKIVPEAGNCPYFPHEQKLPKCHFLNEERRLWEALNNARVKEPFAEDEQFTFDDRHLLFQTLREGKTLTVPLVRKLLPKYLNATITLQGRDAKKQEIKGFRFRTLEEKPFWKRFTEDQQDQFLSIWVNTPDDEQLKSKLESSLFGLSQEEADDALSSIQLIGDYAPIGKTAMMLILKHIEDGMSYTEAIDQCVEDEELQDLRPRTIFDELPYYGEVLSGSTQACIGKAWHSAYKEKVGLASFHKPNTAKEEEKYGRIANPVVHQTLNELRKLMNEVIEIFGKKPSEIVVELAREIKVGAEERDRMSKVQQNREKASEDIYQKYCVPNNLPRKSIQTFRLLDQQGWQCPYCLETINMDDVLNHRVDIDHILPRADTADDSENNKVVAHKHCNLEKGKRTPFDAYSSKPIWSKILNYLDTTEGMYFKKRKFELTDEQYKQRLDSQGFLSRFATDNSYASKIAREYLSCLFKSPYAVRTLKGGETAMLRRSWHIQEIASELASFHYDQEPDLPTDKKDRTDNRHHSLDAIVAGYSTRSYIKKINTMSAQGKCAEEIKENLPIPVQGYHEGLKRDEQIELFKKDIKGFIELQGFVSYKVDNDYNGQLLKDTRYSIVAVNGDDLICLVRKKVKDIKVSNGSADEIKDGMKGKFSFNKGKFAVATTEIVALQKQNDVLFERYLLKLEEAKSFLENKNMELKSIGKKTLRVDAQSISKKALEMCGGSFNLLSNNTRKKVFVVKEPVNGKGGVAFDTGSNLCIDFYHDKSGKLRGEVIRKVNALDTHYVPQYKKNGYVLFERLYQGDVVEIDKETSDLQSRMGISTKSLCGNAADNRVLMKVVTFTETTKDNIQIYLSNLTKSKNGQDTSFYVSNMGDRNPRKITLSSAGLKKFISPILKNISVGG
jgi:CRISPR-associated endonuclease Csn1